MTGWYEAHRAGHNLWPVEGDFGSDASPDAMLAVYRETDDSWAASLIGAGRDRYRAAPLRLAWHGAEPGAGSLSRRDPAAVERAVSRAAGERVEQTGGAERDGLPPARASLDAAISNGEPARRAGAGLGREPLAYRAGAEWSATPSFPVLSGGEGLIRLNVKGRETPGFFERGSAELNDYVEWLKARVIGDPSCRRRRAADQADHHRR